MDGIAVPGYGTEIVQHQQGRRYEVAKKRTIDELLEQKAKIEDEIASLERKRELESLAKSTDVRSLAKQVAKLGLTDEEIVTLVRTAAKPKASRAAGAKTKKSPRQKKTPSIPVATYQHPEEPGTTWSGRGRKPGWILEWIEKGNDVGALRLE